MQHFNFSIKIIEDPDIPLGAIHFVAKPTAFYEDAWQEYLREHPTKAGMITCVTAERK